MPDTLKVGIFQFNIIWEDVLANKKKVETLLSSLPSLPDLLVLPEMYLTGFSMEPSKFVERNLSDQVNWQNQLSKKYGVSIAGSLIQYDSEKYFNRMIFTSSEGAVSYYDKRHLFFEEKSLGGYTRGEKRTIFNCKEVKIFPQICYDLRFPVWSRNNVNYQLLVYSANWPASRQNVWDTLLKARAIENQCYVVGVNRVGGDGNNIPYLGGSCVIDPKGDELIKLENSEAYTQIELSLTELEEFRKKFPVLDDADEFEIF